MVHLLKRIVGSQEGDSDIERLARVKSGSQLKDREWILGAVLQGMEAPLVASPALRREVMNAVDRVVREEVLFVNRQQKPAEVVADFFENEGERVHEFIGWVSGLFLDILKAAP